MTSKISSKYIPLIAYGLLSLLFCFTHYKEGFLILRGDTGYPLAPIIYLNNHMSSWFNTYWTGIPAGHALSFGFPLLVVIYLLNLVLDPSQSQMVLLTGLFFASGYMAYVFFSLTTPENRKSNILGGLFYMLNIVIITEWYVPNPIFFLAYVGLPITAIGCYFLAKCYWRGVFWLVLGYLSIGSGFLNTPFILITMLSNILIIFYFGIVSNLNFGKQLFLVFSVVIIFVLTNLWWLSLLLDFRQEGEAILKTIPLSSWAVDSSRNANILNLLANSFTPSLAGDMMPYTKIIKESLVFLLYLFFPIIFLSHLIKKIRIPHIAYLLIVYLIIMFLVKGTQAPFGAIYSLMVEYIPYFGIFKTPAEKFGVLFLFWQAFIISLTFKKNSHLIVGALIILVLAYPVYTGNLFSEISIAGKSFKAYQKIPQSYKEVAALINKDELNGRVLVLPLVDNYQVSYSSSNYRGLPFFKSMIKKPLIGNSGVERDNVFLFLSNLQDETVFTSWAKRFNVNWIILNKDIGVKGSRNSYREIIDIESMLSSGNGYKRIGTFKNLILYQGNAMENSKGVSSEGIIPHIYAPSKINIIK